jgi:hypothetical protein
MNKTLKTIHGLPVLTGRLSITKHFLLLSNPKLMETSGSITLMKNSLKKVIIFYLLSFLEPVNSFAPI